MPFEGSVRDLVGIQKSFWGSRNLPKYREDSFLNREGVTQFIMVKIRNGVEEIIMDKATLGDLILS